MVRDENLRFMKNRDVYNSDYFNFTLSLASVNAVRPRSRSSPHCVRAGAAIVTDQLVRDRRS